MTYTVVLNNPAQPNANWTMTVQASTHQEAVERAKAQWGTYVLYVKHTPEEEL